jgi:hypothetical protein
MKNTEPFDCPDIPTVSRSSAWSTGDLVRQWVAWNRGLALDGEHPVIRVNVCRRTALKFARPKKRGGPLYVDEFEIVCRPPTQD